MTTYEKNMLRNVLWLLGREPLPARPNVSPANVSGCKAIGKKALHFGSALQKG